MYTSPDYDLLNSYADDCYNKFTTIFFHACTFYSKTDERDVSDYNTYETPRFYEAMNFVDGVARDMWLAKYSNDPEAGKKAVAYGRVFAWDKVSADDIHVHTESYGYKDYSEEQKLDHARGTWSSKEE